MNLKRIYCFFILLLSFLTTVFSEPLKNVPSEYCGTYLPEDYLISLEKYKSHEKALNEISKTHYGALILSEQKCLTTKKFTDGYEIKAENFENWKFQVEETNKIIIDENDFRYIRISEVQNYNGYNAVANFIAHELLKSFEAEDFSVENDFISVENNRYQIFLEPTYSENIPSLFLYRPENHKRYFLKLEDKHLLIFLADRNPKFHMAFESTDKIVYEKTIK